MGIASHRSCASLSLSRARSRSRFLCAVGGRIVAAAWVHPTFRNRQGVFSSVLFLLGLAADCEAVASVGGG
jgi:hypothetical protein